jgi:hypothetical protein
MAHLHDVERVLADANASRVRPTYAGAQSATEAVYLTALEAEERRRVLIVIEQSGQSAAWARSGARAKVSHNRAGEGFSLWGGRRGSAVAATIRAPAA